MFTRLRPRLLAAFFAILLSIVFGWSGTARATFSVAGAVVGGLYRSGGQTPIGKSTIALFQIGTSGYGTSAAKLQSTVSDPNGKFGFAVPACTPANALLYVTARGGIALDVPGARNNPALFMVALLGPCNRLPAFVTIDEITTVASVYALLQFTGTASPYPVSTSKANAIGIRNAAATAGNLANVATGRVPKPPATMLIPVQKINTLANILAYCIGSDGSTSASAPCARLLAFARPPGHTAPADTLGAILDIAHNPTQFASNVFLLFGAAASSPYKPALAAAPADWNLVADFAGGGLGGPNGSFGSGCPTATDRGIAVDASGNIWVSASFGPPPHEGLSEFSRAGVPISPSGGFTNPVFGIVGGLAIDNSANIWLTNFGGMPALDIPSSVIKIPPSNPTCSTSGAGECKVFMARIHEPVDVAISALTFGGDAWVDDIVAPGKVKLSDGGALTEILGSASTRLFRAPGLFVPTSIAADINNNIWLSDEGCGPRVCSSEVPPNILKFANGVGSSFTNADIVDPLGIAVDSDGHIWEADDGSLGSNSSCHTPGTGNPDCAHLTELDKDGHKLSPAGGFTGERMQAPINIAIDGSNNVWVTDDATFCGDGLGQIEEFNSRGMPVLISKALDRVAPELGLVPCGVQDSKFIMSPEGGVAIDSAGNVWAADDGSCSVVEVIGVATPVKTPLIPPLTKP